MGKNKEHPARNNPDDTAHQVLRILGQNDYIPQEAQTVLTQVDSVMRQDGVEERCEDVQISTERRSSRLLTLIKKLSLSPLFASVGGGGIGMIVSWCVLHTSDPYYVPEMFGLIAGGGLAGVGVACGVQLVLKIKEYCTQREGEALLTRISSPERPRSYGTIPQEVNTDEVAITVEEPPQEQSTSSLHTNIG